MIVKGKPRSGPQQLAAYLMRQDGIERSALLHLDYGDDDLRKAFIEWDSIGELTRGEKTLYHAQIAPENRYPMTPEQWKRAAEILAEELGMADHPRAIVIHEGDGRPHAHIVFQRANTDTMTLWDDSYNYVKHERASQRMEREFGHEMVPGKHAKRDRAKQPEFPRADFDETEAQRAKRSGIDPQARKAEVKALFQAADSGPAFKAALEDAGYLLARGERGYLVVDAAGGHVALTRQIDLKQKEVEAFMAAVPLDTLPAIADAKARQKEAALADARSASQPEPPQPAPAQPRSKFVPELAAVPPAHAAGPAAPESGAPAPAKPAALDPVVEQALKERQAKDAAKLIDWQAGELKQLRHVLDLSIEEKLANLNALQKAERDRFEREQQAKRGFIDALKRRLSPKQAAKQAEAEARALDAIKARQEQERKAQIARLTQDKAAEIDALKEKHAQQTREQKARFAEERERYLKEQEAAERLRQRIEAERRERERGPEPPKRGK